MKSLKELRYTDLKLSSTEVYFSRVKDLSKRKIDMDVYLQSKAKNLQRGNVWTLEQKRQLILSIFYQRYVPCVCVMSIIDKQAGTHLSDDIVQIIDGKQRLTTMMEYFDNKFAVELEGDLYYFKDLPADYQQAFSFYEIKCQIVHEDLDKPFTDEQKIDWFMRINYFGTPQELDHLKSLL